MKNSDPNPRHLKGGGIIQRLFSIAVFMVFLYLIKLAIEGNFDAEVARFAAWLENLLG